MDEKSPEQSHTPDKQTMKVIGGRNLPTLGERFDRLQERAHLLFGRGVSPKGVFRFKSFEEFEEWKKAYRLQKPPFAK